MNCGVCNHREVCRCFPNPEEYCSDFEPERPHGKWEHWGSPFTDDTIANSIVCTRCKARYVEIDGEVFNFCPNCGADMRKEGEAE